MAKISKGTKKSERRYTQADREKRLAGPAVSKALAKFDTNNAEKAVKDMRALVKAAAHEVAMHAASLAREERRQTIQREHVLATFTAMPWRGEFVQTLHAACEANLARYEKKAEKNREQSAARKAGAETPAPDGAKKKGEKKDNGYGTASYANAHSILSKQNMKVSEAAAVLVATYMDVLADYLVTYANKYIPQGMKSTSQNICLYATDVLRNEFCVLMKIHVDSDKLIRQPYEELAKNSLVLQAAALKHRAKNRRRAAAAKPKEEDKPAKEETEEKVKSNDKPKKAVEKKKDKSKKKKDKKDKKKKDKKDKKEKA